LPTLEEFRVSFLEKVDAFNRRDWDGVLNGLPDDFQWHFPAGVIDRAEPARPAQLRQAVDDLVSQFRDLKAEPLEIVEPAPGSFVVRLRATGAGSASGAPIQLELAQVWDFDGDTPVRVREFASFSDALAAARH
jgi:hypothetical protein